MLAADRDRVATAVVGAIGKHLAHSASVIFCGRLGMPSDSANQAEGEAARAWAVGQVPSEAQAGEVALRFGEKRKSTDCDDQKNRVQRQPHLFAVSPSSTRRRRASERPLTPLASAQASTFPMNSSDNLNARVGSFPVAGCESVWCLVVVYTGR